jgi:DNA-directed RNA polymerase subunit RPC12/RpoP
MRVPERKILRSVRRERLERHGDAARGGVLSVVEGEVVVHPVECAECGSSIPVARSDDPVDARRPCPACGSSARLVPLHASDEVHFHERVDLKVKEGGRGKPALELRQGDDQHRSSGVWHTIRRVIDRRRNRYEERVVDPDGIVVREISVPLDEHRGHGSDTSRPKSHP